MRDRLFLLAVAAALPLAVADAANPNPRRDVTTFTASGPQVVLDWAGVPAEGVVQNRSVESDFINSWTSAPYFPATRDDDGAMRSRYALTGNDYMSLPAPSNHTAAPITVRRFFDPAQPYLWRARNRYQGEDAGYWTGWLIGYLGETLYDGLTSYGYGADVRPPLGSVLDAELRWDPAPTNRLRARWRIDAGSWTAWTQVPDNWDFYSETSFYTSGAATYPAALWIGSGANNDVGVIRGWGTPVWGNVDYVGFSRWHYPAGCKARWMAGGDMAGIWGGVAPAAVGATEGTYAYAPIDALNPNVPLVPTATDWGPVYSPTVGLDASVTGYRKLRLLTPNHSYPAQGDSYIRVYLRNAADDTLIPDAQVPGNSTGFASVVGETRDISLAGVPAGTEIYLEVRGRTRSDNGALRVQPRLAGAWVYFDFPGIAEMPDPLLAPAVYEADPATPDTTAPTGSLTVPPSPQASPSISVTVSGADETALAAQPYACKMDDAAAPTTWQASEDFSFAGLSLGAHTFYGYVRDAAGNRRDLTGSVTIIDIAAPVVTGLAVPVSPYASTSMDVTVTATDDFGVADYAVTVDTLALPATWQVAPQFALVLAAGTHALRAYARDIAGNVSVASTAEVVIALPPEEPTGPTGSQLMKGNQPVMPMMGTRSATFYKGPKS